MNLVNNAEGSYYVLDHAPWYAAILCVCSWWKPLTALFVHFTVIRDGLTLADLVMPFFLFIVGSSIALAYTRRLERGASKWDLFKKAAIRTLKVLSTHGSISLALSVLIQSLYTYLQLFGLAYFLHLPKWDLMRLRIPGVLQRIAFCYFLSCVIYIFVPVRKVIIRITISPYITYLNLIPTIRTKEALSDLSLHICGTG